MPKRGHIQKHILKNIELAPYQPYISHSSMGIVRWLATGPERDSRISEKAVRNSFYNARKRGYIKEKIINTSENGAKIKFELTKKGKRALRGLEFNDMKTQSPPKWDGYWRVVVFDIPEKNKGIREMLREKLRDLGFLKFQHSVWIHPHECTKEIEVVSEFFHIQQYLLIFSTKLKNDALAQRHFRQKGFKL